jgi:hypothetical protein
MEEGEKCVKTTEHKIDLDIPWRVAEARFKDFEVKYSGRVKDQGEITRLEEITKDVENVSALISYLLIAGTLAFTL